MQINLTYQHTIIACFIGYIVQAIVNNFVPLLFLTFQTDFHITLSQLTFIVTFNFGIQLLVDLLSAYFVDKIGYRIAMCLAHFFVALGFVLLICLPTHMATPYIGILIAVISYAIGGGLLEVLVSPVVEACPTAHKASAMSLLHSFYCWGHVGVVLISTGFFALFGVKNWQYLAILWILIAIFNLIFFSKTPIAPLIEDGQKSFSTKKLLSQKVFWLLLLMMVCAGASELTVSQWSSILAEKSLGLPKAVGDLAGPMSFAIFMGLSRLFYGKYGSKIDLDKFMAISCVLCISSYLMISIVTLPFLNLLGCALCGFSVGIMWPGTFSKASLSLPLGGTLMFALLALGGDVGCALGPTFAGLMASAFNENLQMGILFSIIFPLGLLLLIRYLYKKK